MRAARMAVLALMMAAAAVAGCEADAPAQQNLPKVTSAHQAGDLAGAYCQSHGLYWGRPVMIEQEMDGYYVEFGDGNVHNGLVVGYDGVVHP